MGIVEQSAVENVKCHHWRVMGGIIVADWPPAVAAIGVCVIHQIKISLMDR